jgi:type IV secretion system protein TrbL
MQTLLDRIVEHAAQWSTTLHGHAVRLFWILAAIQFVWTFGNKIFQSPDFGEIVGELVKFVLVTGFFLALLDNGVEWGTAIVDSFRQAGAEASGFSKELMPGDMFATAVEFAKAIGSVETWNPLVAMSVSIAAVLVLLCFAFIAAFMFVTLVESYVVINAAVFFMGFGGASWTREYAIAMPRYAVSVGAKLFILTLLVGLILQISKEWQADYNYTDDASMWTMVGLAFVCAYLTKTIPEIIGGLISGTSMGGGSAIGSMAAASIGAAAGAAGATIAMGGAGAAGGASSALGGGSAGSAGSGLANSLNASMASGPQNAAPAAMSSMNSAATTGTATGGSAAAQSAGSRVGGSQAAKPEAGSGINGQSDIPHSSSLSGPQQAAQTLKKATSGANKAAGVAVRGLGTLSAIAVPGMEGAAGMGGGTPPQLPAGEDSGESHPANSSTAVDVAETNVIRPAQEPSAAPAQPTGSEKTNNPKQEGDA